MEIKELIKKLHLKEHTVINSDRKEKFLGWERCFLIDRYSGYISIDEHGHSFYFHIERTNLDGSEDLLYKVVSHNKEVFELVIEKAEKDLKIKF